MKCEACGGKGWISPPGGDPHPTKYREQYKCPANCGTSQMIDRSRKAIGNPERKEYMPNDVQG